MRLHPLDYITIKIIFSVIPFWLLALWYQRRLRKAREEF